MAFIYSENLVVTSGATHGLHLVASVLIGANAPVFVEDPTYFIAIDIVKKDLGRPVLGGKTMKKPPDFLKWLTLL